MRTVIASLMTGIVAAVVAALIVVAVDGNAPAAAPVPANALTGIATREVSGAGAPDGIATEPSVPGVERQPVAADGAEAQAGASMEPNDLPARTESLTPAFDPVRIYAEVSPSVVSIDTDFGGGTGFWADAAGHVVTNYHVIEDARSIVIRNPAGESTPATLLGVDTANDLAVLQVDPALITVTPVVFADSDAVQVGEPVAAIGSPFGLDNSITTGIVSAIERTRQGLTPSGRPQRGLIQTDAAVNPGNSGGVLLNADGAVIGVTNSVESPIRGSVGVGFAIPSNVITRFLPRLIAGETIVHPWMGIFGSGAAEEPGLLVGGVVDGSPAALAALREGDRLLSIDGVALEDFGQLAEVLDGQDVGDLVTFEVGRGAETLSVPMTLVAWPG